MEWLDALRQDVRLAVRTLARDPAFAAAALITLAFSIGLAVAMFTVFDAVLQRPLPVRDQDRIVVLWGEADGSVRRLPLHYEHFERFRQAPHALQEVAGTLNARASRMVVRDGERALTLNVAPVTGNFFDVLGSPPVIGRTLRADDDVVGAERVTVVSHGLWRRRFGGDRNVIGRRLTLHARGLTYTVVGVAQPGLEYPAGADLWIPMRPFVELEAVPLGRLAPHATPAHAAAELRASFERDASRNWRIRGAASPLRDVVIGNVRPALLVLSAAAALLLLVACINVANLLLARASGRMHEIATRQALGASPGRILRQLLTESSVLAIAGGLLGALLAVGLVQGLLALAPPELPRLEEIRLAGVPLWIAACITGAATLGFGLLPALFTSREATSSLRAGDRSSTAPKGRRRAQHALVVFQIALAIIVLVAGSLLARTLQELERLDMGFTSDRLAIVHLTRPEAKDEESIAQVRALHDRLISHVEALPGVVSATSVSMMPFGGATGGIDGHFIAESLPDANEATSPYLNMEVVGPGYFRTLDVPLLHGRPITESDREDSPRVVVVSEKVSRLFWPGQNAVGKRLGMGQPERPEDWWTVVGVVPETRYRAMREPLPTVYLPHRQFGGSGLIARMLAIRTTGDPASVLPSVRHAVQEMDPDLVVTEAQTMAGLLAGELARPRLSAALLGVFGIGALLLAAVGLYAMLAYVVRRRTRELAIRHALGASPARLRALVLRQGLALTGAGVVLGLATALAGGSLVQSLLFGVSPADPLTLAAVPLVLLAVALAACYIPAQRATRADPVTVLRAD